MISRNEWTDRLTEDKVKYYNRTRMSIEMFGAKIGIAPQLILREMRDYGYQYDPSRRLLFFRPCINPLSIIRGR